MASQSALSYEETTTILTEIALLLEDTFDAKTILKLLQNSKHDINHSRLFQRLQGQLEKEPSLATALGAELTQLESFNVKLLQQAERNDTFISTLQNIIAYREKRENSDLGITQNFSFISSYYLLLLIIFSFIFLGTVIYIMPVFSELYDGFGAELPLLTNIFFNLNNSLFLIPFSLLIIGMFYLLVRQSSLKAAVKYLPLLGKLYQQLAVIEHLNKLAFLLRNGYSLSDALTALAESGTQKEQQRLQQAAIQAQNQQPLSALKDLFPEIILDLLTVSKSTQGLPNLLERLARLKAQQLQQSSMLTSRILTAIFSAIFGLLLLMFVISIYLPIFKMGAII